MKRKHEEISKKSLETWLDDELADTSQLWDEVPQELEPPDWYLEVGSKRFAVEVSSVVDHLWEFDPPLPSAAISASLHAFVKRLEERAKEKGPLGGAYLVALAPMPNLRQHEDRLLEEFLAYIDRTRDQEEAETHRLGRLRNDEISITKAKSDKEYVAELISFGAKFEGQAFEDLAKILSVVVKKKSSQTEQIGDPIILLLLDAFNYSHIADWSKALDSVASRHDFETIFRTRVDEKAELLFSKSQWWTSS